MDLARLGTGERIALASAAILVLSMLVFGWYSIEGAKLEESSSGQTLELNKDDIEEAAGDDDTSGSAFQAFEFIDILLVLAAAVVAGGVVARLMGMSVADGLGPVIAAAGGIAFLLVLFRLIFPPDLIGNIGEGIPDNVEIDIDVGRSIGVFIGLIAAAGMAYGTYLMNSARPSSSGAPPQAPPASEA